MKRILLSFSLFAASYFLMRWFNHTDQGMSGRQLGLDAPSEQMATGLPFMAGWLSILLGIVAVILLIAGFNQFKQNLALANEPVKADSRLPRIRQQMRRRKAERIFHRKA